MVLERLSWRVTFQNHARFRLLTVAGRGSCGPTTKSARLNGGLERGAALKLVSLMIWSVLEIFYYDDD